MTTRNVAATVVLDNEPVQALLDPRHAKHRRALALVEATVARNLRRAGSQRLAVPTSVRVEAGWACGAPRAAAINRLRATDAALDGDAADRAVAIRSALGVSVPNAHLGAVVGAAGEPVAVVTSDVDDIERIAHHLGQPVTVVRL
jgi:hypothetical protein